MTGNIFKYLKLHSSIRQKVNDNYDKNAILKLCTCHFNTYRSRALSTINEECSQDVECLLFKDYEHKETLQATHIIIDLNGTLLDSEQRNYKSSNDYVNRVFKKHISIEIYGNIMSTDMKKAADIIVKELTLPITSEIYKHGIYQNQLINFPKSQLLPGVETLTKHLKNHEIPMALITSTNEKLFHLATRCHKNILKCFDPIIICGDEPCMKGRNKPDPFPFLFTARKFVKPPCKLENILVIEDSLSGVRAARAAGMQVVMIPHPDLPQFFIDLAQPDVVVKSLTELDLSLFDLPPM